MIPDYQANGHGQYWQEEDSEVATTHHEPDVSFADVVGFTDMMISRHKSGIEIIMLKIAHVFTEDGVCRCTSIADIASEDDVCAPEVLAAARILVTLGVIDLVYKGPPQECKCDSCQAQHNWVNLRVDFSVFHDAVKVRREQDVAQAQAQARKLVQRKTKHHGFVYLIRCGARYKIGMTRDMNRRLDQLRGQSPYPLELVHYAQGYNNGSMESKLHRQFADSRVFGEWFELDSDQIASVIESLNDWQRRGTEA